jgi:gas vesicle protein
MSKRSDVFVAFVAGAAVGAAVGILFAPDNGKNTRNKLGFKLEKYKDKLKDLITKYTNGEVENAEIITTAKSEGMKVVKDARTQAEALLSDVEDLIGQINKGRTV